MDIIVDSSDEEVAVDTSKKAVETGQTSTTTTSPNFNSEESTPQVHINTVSTVGREVSSERKMEVPESSDAILEKCQETDKKEKDKLVHNVLDILDPILRETFTGLPSDEESYTKYNSDSESYVARDIEEIDCLDFDDSDISIDENF